MLTTGPCHKNKKRARRPASGGPCHKNEKGAMQPASGGPCHKNKKGAMRPASGGQGQQLQALQHGEAPTAPFGNRSLRSA
eukprot:360003-Chlamydomonas_euryale.AAC.1